MKALVIGDSHGHIANLRAVMEIAKKSNIDAVIHCGDWDNKESMGLVKESGLPLYTVAGNADVSLKLKDFLVKDIGEKKIGITHKPSDNKKFFIGKSLDIIFNGHLHSKFEGEWNGIKIIRPGALIKGINFAVYDTASGKIEFVNEQD